MIIIETPIGTLQTEVGDKGIEELKFFDNKTTANEESTALETSFKRELEEYFEGKRKDFDVEVMLDGTEFQKLVWEELRRIPYGETASYGEIARRIGRPKACRAVANACRQNKVWILVPCHRVIGSDGSLTGYAGGFEAKRFLLDLESQ